MQDDSLYAPSVRPALFDRFGPNSEATVYDDLARHLADILGARRSYPSLTSGVLGWGLPDVCNLTPSAQRDHDTVASHIETAIMNFEPRLDNIRVTPIRDSLDFAFRLEARVVQEADEWISLRILAPLRSGGLGARVVRIEQGGSGSRGEDID